MTSFYLNDLVVNDGVHDFRYTLLVDIRSSLSLLSRFARHLLFNHLGMLSTVFDQTCVGELRFI